MKYFEILAKVIKMSIQKLYINLHSSYKNDMKLERH